MEVDRPSDLSQAILPLLFETTLRTGNCRLASASWIATEHGSPARGGGTTKNFSLILCGLSLLSGCGGGSMGGSPKATLSATSLTFPSEAVGTPSPAQTITLSNSGTGTLSNVIIGGAGPSFEETSTCGSTLTSGANCVISVTFVPGTTGDLSGTVSVTDDAPGSPQNVALSGTGISGTPSGTLSGYCFQLPVRQGHPGCTITSDPTNCPPGQLAKSPGYKMCTNSFSVYLDSASGCALQGSVFQGECEVVP